MIDPAEILTEEQEFKLASAIQKHGREEDVIKLVMANLKEAVRYTMTCSKEKLTEGELISLCYETMMKNARRFIPGGLRFFQFTKIGLRGAIYRHWTSLKTVRNASEIVSVDKMSFPTNGSESYNGDDPADHCLTREAQTREIVEPDFESVYTRDRWESIKPIVDKVLTDHEKMILDLLFVQGMTCRQVGTLFDRCRERIRQIREEAIRKIRCELLRQGRLYNNN